mgnify:CR=1 FL=1
MKKEKEALDIQLRNMGITPPTGPSYIPTPAEMRMGTNLTFPGMDPNLGRDRSMTTESFGGDIGDAMFVSNPGSKARTSGLRIRSSSESENVEGAKGVAVTSTQKVESVLFMVNLKGTTTSGFKLAARTQELSLLDNCHLSLIYTQALCFYCTISTYDYHGSQNTQAFRFHYYN